MPSVVIIVDVPEEETTEATAANVTAVQESARTWYSENPVSLENFRTATLTE